MGHSALSLSDHDMLILVVSALSGVVGAVTGVIIKIGNDPGLPLKGRRFFVALYVGLFVGGVVFAMLGNVAPPQKELVTAAAFFALLLGCFGGQAISNKMDDSLRVQALMAEVLEADNLEDLRGIVRKRQERHQG